MKKDLVIIVDEKTNARQSGRNLPKEWFRGAKGTKGEYGLETPLGDVRTVRGNLLESFDLDYITSEYFYLDLTNACNYRCSDCGIKDDTEVLKIQKTPLGRSARYVTDHFIEAVASAISKYPLPTGHRNLFYGGGEPLINPAKFAEINRAFSKVEKTTRVVITNGLALPIQEEKFVKFVKQMDNPYIMLTYTESHAKQYAALARSEKDLSKWIPDVEPRQALTEKVRRLNKICKKHDLDFTVNIVYPNGESPPQELRDLILEGALQYVKTDINGHRHPCSKNKETSIRFNGDIHPHCYDVFSKRNKLGVIGFLN